MKLKDYVKEQQVKESLPPRGAWIEIRRCFIMAEKEGVAPPTGSVD